MSSRIGRIGRIGGVILLGMAGCASGPGESDLLPDEGPTTLQLYERHLAGEPLSGASSAPGDAAAPSPSGRPRHPRHRAGSRCPAARSRKPPTPKPAGSRAALDDLQRDFQRVPNPEILGYVYPHRAEGMPVPGYYTAFPLRDGLHYAEPGEGFYPGDAP